MTVVSKEIESLSQGLGALEIKYSKKDPEAGPVERNCHLVMASGLQLNSALVQNLVGCLKADGFLLLDEGLSLPEKEFALSGLNIVARLNTQFKTFILLRLVRPIAKIYR
jgi:hypothetical protein